MQDIVAAAEAMRSLRRAGFGPTPEALDRSQAARREAARGWLPPVPVGDELLHCAYCERTFPRWYQNQTGPRTPNPRDGYVRLEAHIYDAHYHEHKRAKSRASSKRSYERRKAARLSQ